ncbi:GAF domain-containing protein [Actinoplanes sp. G11-F43]|uniref:GAF domain-containing protein n=1 Tax=Actinoplanes sp. G11-F43 TaxID=3424130 RepID=UPI003D338673
MVGAGAVVLIIGFLGAWMGMGEVLTAWTAVLVVVAGWAVRRDFVQSQGRAARWRARFLLPTMFLLFTATGVVSGAFAVANAGARSGMLVGVCLVAMVCTFLLGKLTLIRAEVAAEKSFEQELRGVALTRTAQPLITALGDIVAAETESEREKATDVLVRLTVSVAKAVCGQNLSRVVNTRAIFYQLESDSVATRRAYDGTYEGVQPRWDFDARRSLNDKRVLELAKGDRVLVVNDIDASPPAHFADYQGRPYKSYVAVPVRAGDTAFGVLAIDSDTPNSLTDVDVGYAILVAGILGAGLAAADSPVGGTAGTRPAHSLVGEIARSLEVVFAQDLPGTAVSFSLNPSSDRDVLEALHGEHGDQFDALEKYWNELQELAERRAERGLRRMNQVSAQMLLGESTEPVYRVPGRRRVSR